MSVATDVVVLGVTAVGLWVGSVWLVDGAARTATRFGVSPLVVGLTVVSLGTSTPEFVVTLDGALTGKASLSVGNVVGSNVFNLGVVLGAVALVREVPGSTSLVRRDCVTLLVATAVTGAFLLDGRLARVEGVALVAGAVAYLALLARSDGVTASTEGFDPLDVGRGVAGLAVVVVSGHFLVLAAADLARLVGVSEWVIGATVVAAGTSTPELATSVAAAAREENAIAAGNLVGSSIFNLAAVLGLAVVIRPLTVEGPAVASVGATFLLVALVAALFWTGHHLSRREGVALLVVSGAYWAWTVF